ncbi:MAG: indole-3-glycerol phosphate synthase TrpC [Clostridiaceae bacterium]|nr:indole-3-glycerol phosphate synthase TrpC [Clostridiaceae bacterium]
MNILDKIVINKQKEIKWDKKNFPLQFLLDLIAEGLPSTRDFFGCLNNSSNISIIAELKFTSPSRGVINKERKLEEIIRAYTVGGAAAISVLTERNFFQGDPDNIRKVKKITTLPVLRKDFILDKYQIYQSRCLGADAILLIASLLDKSTLMRFQKIASSLGMDCLVEVHNIGELNKTLAAKSNIIGINNRNLDDFSIDLSTTGKLSHLIPRDCLLISESGIKKYLDLEKLSFYGIDAVLIGEALMSADNPENKLKGLLGVLKRKEEKKQIYAG